MDSLIRNIILNGRVENMNMKGNPFENSFKSENDIQVKYINGRYVKYYRNLISLSKPQ